MDQVNADKNLGNESVDRKTEQGGLRELDAEVAQRLGWHRDANQRGPLSDWHEPVCGGEGRCAPSCGFELPRYSSDIAAAMDVVEKMREQGWSFACTLYEGKLPYASFCKRTAASSRNAEAISLSEAICRAALKATDCLSISDRRNAEMRK